jgi:CheY-like chemotaxis protein
MTIPSGVFASLPTNFRTLLKTVILLVEDHEVTRRTYARLLGMRGYKVIEAADGEAAVSLLDQHQFDLVITDLAMPKLTGFGLASLMRVKWPKIPIILITGYLSPAVANTILRYNVVKFLSKPVDPNKLISTVEGVTSPPH